MRIIFKTLLLIAFFVQLPLSALAMYSDLNHPHQHHHTHEADDHSHQHGAELIGASDGSHASNDCTTHHHCGGTHLSALPISGLQSAVISSREVFSALSEAPMTSAEHIRIERPNWATL